MRRVEAYTDGACSGNPGPGGWGALLRLRSEGPNDGAVKELFGGEALTTNNRMELLAAINALNSIKEGTTVELHTDSKYVMDGISRWIHGWKRNGWKTADKKPVKNGELWQALDEARARHKVNWHWVKGHAGHPENERADELARQGMAPFKPARSAGMGAAVGEPATMKAAASSKRRPKPAKKTGDREDETATLADGRKARRSSQSY